MLVVAAIGLASNLAGILLLKRVSGKNLNIKAAFLHIVGDLISSIGVIIAGIIILLTGWYIADLIIAILIGGIILWGAVQLVRQAVDILLETVPSHISIDKLIESIKQVNGVEDVHDIHIWTITSGIHAMSSHLIIEDQMVSRSEEIVATVNDKLVNRFNITHTTLQLECNKCYNCPSGFICEISHKEDKS
jgi:cobalt-zinc-cadmium efflux system protein